MGVYTKSKSIPAIERELRNYEIKLADIKKSIEWKQDHSWDMDFIQYIDVEISKIDDVVYMCHEKITEIKSLSQELREYIFSDLEYLLSDLKQKIDQLENCSEDYNQYRDCIDYF